MDRKDRQPPAMKTTVKWVDNVMFVAETGSGHGLVIDGPPESGGRNLGPRPMELLLAGLGGCSSFDVVSILKKSRQQITDCRCEVSAERAEQIPKVFTRIHLHFVVTGHALKDAQVERAVSLSADKYCSASLMLGQVASVTHDYEVVQATTAVSNAAD